MSNKDMIATNYFTAQMNELHIAHVGQLQQLNEVIESQDKAIRSLERTADDQSATISQLRNKLIEMDKELNAQKTSGSVGNGSSTEAQENSEAETKCDCPICRAAESDELPEPIRKIAEMLSEMNGVEGVGIIQIKG